MLRGVYPDPAAAGERARHDRESGGSIEKRGRGLGQFRIQNCPCRLAANAEVLHQAVGLPISFRDPVNDLFRLRRIFQLNAYRAIKALRKLLRPLSIDPPRRGNRQ
jgi:hypothetical protein